jgi:phage terminase large subunit
MVLDPKIFFNPTEAHKNFFKSTAREILLCGSRGSGKSFTAADKIIYNSLISEAKGLPLKSVVMRTSYQSLKDSSVNTYRERLSAMQVPHECLMTIPFTIKLKGGSQILFLSIPNESHLDNIKSITDCNFLHIEECTSLKEDWYLVSRLMVRGKPGQIRQRILTCNPKNKSHWVYKRFIQNPVPGSEYIFARAEDNPFLDPRDIEDLKMLKDTNPIRYKIDYLGEWISTEGLVYSNWDIVDDIPFVPSDEWYGIDFGFTEPCAIIKISKCDGELYLEEKLYKTGLQPNQLILQMKRLVPFDAFIYADSSRPELISELFNAGWKNIRRCKKGPGSIEEGINFVRDQKLHILCTSVNLIDEIEKYSNRVDKDGVALDIPIDKDNHLCLAGNTKIQTNLGLKDIKDIKIGDLVLTRKGFKSVIDSQCTGIQETNKYNINNNIIEATFNHKVKTTYGEKNISDLKVGDKLWFQQQNFQQTNIIKPFIVQKVVQYQVIGKPIKQRVYNITVEDDHEYFANNILVSNCDAMRYSIHDHLYGHKPRAYAASGLLHKERPDPFGGTVINGVWYPPGYNLTGDIHG